jgi:hypothetical protein
VNNRRLLIRLTISVSICLCSVTSLYAAAAPPAIIQETQEGSNTEYSVLNQSQLTPQPFFLSLFAVTTTGDSPTTTNFDWFSEYLTSVTWTQTMAQGTNQLPLTWEQYTTLSWDQAFPNYSGGVNGYWMECKYDIQGLSFPGGCMPPGAPSLGGFFSKGTTNSMFLVMGPTDISSPQPLSTLQSYSGLAVDVPEPSSLALCIMALCGCCVFQRSRRRLQDRSA